MVLARPFQAHLAQREQVILRTVYDTFAAGFGIARDFSLLPREFKLDGCSVSLFERQRPSAPTTALALLATLEERVPQRPGMQTAWVVVDSRFPSWLSRNPDASTSLVAHPSPRGASPSTTFVALDRFDAPVTSEGNVRFHDARCEGATLRFWAMEGGTPRVLEEVQRRPEDDGHFSVRIAQGRGERIFLSVLEHSEGASIDFCLLTIDPLVIGRAASSP